MNEQDGDVNMGVSDRVGMLKNVAVLYASSAFRSIIVAAVAKLSPVLVEDPNVKWLVGFVSTAAAIALMAWISTKSTLKQAGKAAGEAAGTVMGAAVEAGVRVGLTGTRVGFGDGTQTPGSVGYGDGPVGMRMPRPIPPAPPPPWAPPEGVKEADQAVGDLKRVIESIPPKAS